MFKLENIKKLKSTLLSVGLSSLLVHSVESAKFFRIKNPFSWNSFS